MELAVHKAMKTAEQLVLELIELRELETAQGMQGYQHESRPSPRSERGASSSSSNTGSSISMSFTIPLSGTCERDPLAAKCFSSSPHTLEKRTRSKIPCHRAEE